MKTDPAKTDSTKTEPARTDPTKIDPMTIGDAGNTAGAQAFEPTPETDEQTRPPWAGWDQVVRVAGVVVAVVAALVTGFLEILLSTLRAGDVVSIWRGDAIGSGGGPLLWLSVVLAVVLNYAIAWFSVTTTRRRWSLAPPWALWTLIMLFAAGVRTSEGDYLLGGENWVALVTILAGSLTYAVYSYRLILKRRLP
ncbi:hypothetical protein [Actinoplanes sp. M2I2]|uniref:hypothetical protein n=1 Tax=Actinoplanes sp. M2I2 TaxID=1734444 RepID=UPI002022245D|nr:hypothetical protein [Actinoplanes sp. M2I2]